MRAIVPPHWFGWRPRRLGRPAVRRWRLAGLVLVLAAVGLAGVEFAGVFTSSASPAARVSLAGHSQAGSAGRVGASALAAARSQAATWIASQVSGGTIVACDAGMCAALQARGVAAGRLLLRPRAADILGPSVIVASSSVPGQLAGEYAPALIASFGSGDARIDVRATVPGGAAAYKHALQADLATRKAAGSQLLENRRIKVTAQDSAQLRAGEVDSRLLVTLATLAARHPLRVTAFGDASPGAQVPLRQVTITMAGGGSRAAGLPAALATERAQLPPYLPARVTIVHLAFGQAALSIEFAAPGPLGLLSAVLQRYLQRATARPTVMATSPHLAGA